MKYSQLYTKTTKNAKAYDSINATLLIKAGYVDQVMAGVYNYLPLGLRVLTKIENIVREEMDQIGVEILMSTLAPVANWKITKRYEKVSVLMKAVPASAAAARIHDGEYVVSPTHEELVTPLAKQFIQSYKDLPCAYYQIQTKFRNEPRAKSGLLRGREFRMKDLYSFHSNQQDFQKYYEKAKEVYMNIFKRLGLGTDTFIALASGGDFTEDYSHEFQTLCETGEDTIFYAPGAGIYYNREVAPSQVTQVQSTEAPKPKADILGKGIIGVDELSRFLKIPVTKTTKTLIYETAEGQIIAAAVRGDYAVNEYKLAKAVGTKSIKLASADKVKAVTNAEIGYAGVLNLPANVAIYFDDSCRNRVNFETGANRTDYHTVNVNFGRDLSEPDRFYDIKEAKAGDLYPVTGEVYQVLRASEVGNIFSLGTKFADDFSLNYLDEKGKLQKIIMGCYGIGTSRLMGVIVEKFHDGNGIIWPKSVSPYHVHLIRLAGAETKADDVYHQLTKSGLEVLYDDRNESAGVKFADCDLIGIPFRLVVSPKTGDRIEWRIRTEQEIQTLSVEEVIAKLKSEYHLSL